MGVLPNAKTSDDEVVMSFPDNGGTRITAWKEYSYNSDFAVPTDAWYFTVGAETLDEATLASLRPGHRVTLSINGHIQGDGYIDRVSIDATREGGREYTVVGRDRLAQAIDACADPTVQFKATQTISEVLSKIFEPFGWSIEAGGFLPDNDLNVSTITGQKRGIKTSKKGKPLKSFQIHQLRPYSGEGAFNFAARIAQRFGRWIWLSAEGNSLILGTPNFEREPLYSLTRGGITGANIKSGRVVFDIADQPSIVVADGFSGGGEFGHSRIRALAINPAVTVPSGAHTALLARYKDAKIIELDDVPNKLSLPAARPMYLHDDESKTLEQLEFFVRREMSVRLKNTVRCYYEVNGHCQLNLAGEYVPWCVDTTAYVDDAAADLREVMWIQARTFLKSRTAGTRTTLELIRKNTLQF